MENSRMLILCTVGIIILNVSVTKYQIITREFPFSTQFKDLHPKEAKRQNPGYSQSAFSLNLK